MRSLFILIVLLLSVFVVVAEAPPSLVSHQVYGTVSWDKAMVVPKQVIVKTSTMTYYSVIKAVPCVDLKCSGSYGFDKDNVLRVQSSGGAKLQFFIDTVKVLEQEYVADAVTKVDLELKEEVVPVQVVVTEKKENVSGQASSNLSSADTGPSNSSSVNTGSSKKSSSSVKNETPSLQPCTKSWTCGGWSSCAASSQTRSCVDEKDCDKLYAEGKVSFVISAVKPKEVQSCVMPLVSAPVKGDVVVPAVKDDIGGENEAAPVIQKPKPAKATCSDGLKNQNEESVDCGGVCKPCEGGFLAGNIMYYILGVVVLIGLGVGVYFFMKSREGGRGVGSSEVDMQLSQVYSSGEAKGLSEEEITSRLVAKGWDESVIDRFLKGR